MSARHYWWRRRLGSVPRRAPDRVGDLGGRPLAARGDPRRGLTAEAGPDGRRGHGLADVSPRADARAGAVVRRGSISPMTYPDPTYMGEGASSPPPTVPPTARPTGSTTTAPGSTTWRGRRTPTGCSGCIRRASAKPAHECGEGPPAPAGIPNVPLGDGSGAGGPGPHFHRTISESFYVLLGTVRIFDGTDWVDVTPGGFAHVPIGGIHGFHNATTSRPPCCCTSPGGALRGPTSRGCPAWQVWTRKRGRRSFWPTTTTGPKDLVAQWYRLLMALTLRTDDELDRALDVLTAAEGLSRQEVIRRAVIERYERAGHVSRVGDSTDRMLERWGDVLDRLGSV